MVNGPLFFIAIPRIEYFQTVLTITTARAVAKNTNGPSHRAPSTEQRLGSSTEQRLNEKQRVVSEEREGDARSEISEGTTAFASIPYIKGVSERVRHILGRENVKTAFRPVKT